MTAGKTLYQLPVRVAGYVLERLVGANPHETLRTRVHPFGLPFSLRNKRLQRYLNYLRVTPEELYRLFAAQVDHDLVAATGLDAASVATALADADGTAEVPAVTLATASAVMKPAKLETGLMINVPPFINNGDKVKVDTSEARYVQRAQ